MDKVDYKVDAFSANKTIKEVLKSFYVGRGMVEKIRVNHLALLNGKQVDIETKVNNGDVISFLFDEEIDISAAENECKVLYEDDDILIVDKPCNMLVHIDGDDKKITLCSLVAKHYLNEGIKRNVRYIHRLDLETTGAVLFAKNFLIEAFLHHEIEEHKIDREYLALTEIAFEHDNGCLSYRIGRDRHDSRRYRVSSTGVDAVTYYHVEKKLKNNVSLVRLRLKTGRTHQIRVHLSYQNHPLLGDPLYGGSKQLMHRVALHSADIKFYDPISCKDICVICPLPADMERILTLMKK